MINDHCNCPSYWKSVDLYLYNSELYFLATLSFIYLDFLSKILEIVSTGLIYATWNSSNIEKVWGFFSKELASDDDVI